MRHSRLSILAVSFDRRPLEPNPSARWAAAPSADSPPAGCSRPCPTRSAEHRLPDFVDPQVRIAIRLTPKRRAEPRFTRFSSRFAYNLLGILCYTVQPGKVKTTDR